MIAAMPVYTSCEQIKCWSNGQSKDVVRTNTGMTRKVRFSSIASMAYNLYTSCTAVLASMLLHHAAKVQSLYQKRVVLLAPLTLVPSQLVCTCHYQHVWLFVD
jgi:hypothetical protein